MVDEDVVHEAEASSSARSPAPEVVVLEICVLGAHGPAAIVRVAAGLQLLEDVGRYADAGPIARRHAEREVHALEIELVRRACGTSVGPILEVRKQDAREIDRKSTR